MDSRNDWLVHGLITETLTPVVLVDKGLYRKSKTVLTTETQAESLYEYIKTYAIDFIASKPSISCGDKYLNIIPVVEIEIF